jgi:hypothetical protein
MFKFWRCTTKWIERDSDVPGVRRRVRAEGRVQAEEPANLNLATSLLYH